MEMLMEFSLAVRRGPRRGLGALTVLRVRVRDATGRGTGVRIMIS